MYLLKSAMVENAFEDDLGIGTTLRAKEIFCLVLGFKGETSSTFYLDLLGAISKRKDWILAEQEEMKTKKNG